MDDPEGTLSGENFFTRNTEQRREIIEGVVREGQLVALGGAFGVGKSPLLADLALCLLNGIPWGGRKTERRPVVLFDIENPGPTLKQNMKRIAKRYGVRLPQVPEEMEVYLQHDTASEPATAKLLAALASRGAAAQLKLISEALERKPTAAVFIDPIELLFPIDTGKKQHVLALYKEFRLILAKCQHASIWLTFNLRKRDRQNGRPELLSDPRGWLEEVCGTLDIHNRSDVRLGMDFYGDEARVVNGVRRGEEMDPLLIRPVGDPIAGLAGFEICPPSGLNLVSALTYQQRKYWDALPKEFRFDDIAEKIVPRSSLSRLLRRAKSLALIREDAGTWRKVEP